MLEIYGIFSVRAGVGDAFVLSEGVGAAFELAVCEVMFMVWIGDSIFCVVGGVNLFV